MTAFTRILAVLVLAGLCGAAQADDGLKAAIGASHRAPAKAISAGTSASTKR